jgi:translation initiation factor 3 subunit D
LPHPALASKRTPRDHVRLLVMPIPCAATAPLYQVLATELKNNSCKLAKWAAQSVRCSILRLLSKRTLRGHVRLLVMPIPCAATALLYQVIAGADQMKIGFVSRKSRTDRHNHLVLATQFYKPAEFATQITLTLPNMWGVIKFLSDKFLSMDDGKYVLMKDPNKPIVRIYSVPQSTFEEDDEDDEDGGDDDEDGAAEE